jgi:hypothetical protein
MGVKPEYSGWYFVLKSEKPYSDLVREMVQQGFAPSTIVNERIQRLERIVDALSEYSKTEIECRGCMGPCGRCHDATGDETDRSMGCGRDKGHDGECIPSFLTPDLREKVCGKPTTQSTLLCIAGDHARCCGFVSDGRVCKCVCHST